MRTRRNLVTGIAAAALTLTACGIAAGNAGGTPGDHAAPVPARHALAGTWAAYEEDLAGVKRQIAWTGGDPVRAGQPRADTSWFTSEGDLAQIKRDTVRHARSG